MRLKLQEMFLRHQYRLMRISVGVLFLWFGTLKFFPGVSPAEQLVIQTIDILSFGFIPDMLGLKLLAILEVFIGIMLITTKEYRITFWFLIFHMLCTVLPMFVLTEVTFKRFPFQPTLEGQYIAKNIVIICMAFVLLYFEETKRKSNGTNL